jgi:thymidine kinase
MSIHLILGPMFAGKTTELLRLGHRHELAGRRVVHVRHELDSRGRSNHNSLYTHNGLVPVANVRRASQIKDVIDELISNCVDVVCIDEGHFFPDLAVMTHVFLANMYPKFVIIAALNATYRQQMFAQVVYLLPMAERVQWLTAVCFQCGSSEAVFTKRLNDHVLDHSVLQVKFEKIVHQYFYVYSMQERN